MRCNANRVREKLSKPVLGRNTDQNLVPVQEQSVMQPTPKRQCLSTNELSELLRKRNVPKGTWNHAPNHKLALDVVRQYIGASDDVTKWYGVTYALMKDLGLSGLLSNHYRSSSYRFLEANMPSDEWRKLRPYRFACVPQNYWDNNANHKDALNDVRRIIGADTNVTKWYDVTKDFLYSIRLGGLLKNKYSNNYKLFLQMNMPPDEWVQLLPWMFKAVGKHYWNDWKHHKEVLDFLRNKIGACDDVTKWYGVTQNFMREMKLIGLLSKYQGSPQRFMQATMPPDEWNKLQPWMFKGGVTDGFWDDLSNHKRAFDYIRKSINADGDSTRWYGVTKDFLYSMKLGGLLGLKYHDSPQAFLKMNMPLEEWNKLDSTQFGFVSAQEQWCIWIVEAHPDFEILGADCRDKRAVTFSSKRYRWDLVIRHVPSGKIIALEVDGEHHFLWKNGGWVDANRRDIDKMRVYPNHPPSCASHIDIVARISYHNRRYMDSVTALLGLVSTTDCGFVCLPQDKSMYTDGGVPVCTRK